MLDVIHTLFEDDVLPHAEGYLETRSKMRTSIYQSLYDQEYRYAMTTTDTTTRYGSSQPMYELPPDEEINAKRKAPPEPLQPATPQEDWARILGPPLG